MGKVLAVQLPAPCPMHCAFCRTPEHGNGDIGAVRERVFSMLQPDDEVYLTSNGETGLALGFAGFVRELIGHGALVSVLCATPHSIVPGLGRAEISWNQYTAPMADPAIAKAKSLGVPVVLSLVDEDNGSIPKDLSDLALERGVSGILVRAQQCEGSSLRQAGTTRSWKSNTSSIGTFPVVAYPELDGLGEKAICIDHFGKEVEWLGAHAA